MGLDLKLDNELSMVAPMFTVIRRAVGPGAFGMFWFNGEASPVPFAVTLERTYEDAGRIFTKIPDGLHLCTRRRYNKGGYDTWEIHVEGHDAILFHKGNKELDSAGCCLIAESFADLDPAPGIQPGIADSAGGFGEFMKLTAPLDTFYVEFITV